MLQLNLLSWQISFILLPIEAGKQEKQFSRNLHRSISIEMLCAAQPLRYTSTHQALARTSSP
jgi:hypothetical protein